MRIKIKNTFKEKKQYYHAHNKFKVAFNGIKLVFREEGSFRYQFILLLITFLFGLAIGLSKIEWVAIIFSATIVFTFEMVNTAIENMVDMISPNYNKMAGKIKDISAGAVLVSSFGALLVGALIFIPKIVEIFF